jgi:primosomal protein N' (replication factor Y)
VGSEADLAALPIQDLIGVVDADGLLLGTHFRAAEEAIRILGRVAGKVGRGGTRRAIVQTALQDHPAMVALKNGKALPFLHSELAIRRELGYPPAGELMIVELRGQVPADPRRALIQLDDGIDLLGPAQTRNGIRFLAQGNSLDMLRTGLRPVVQRWRDSGTIVRIDADPLEL